MKSSAVIEGDTIFHFFLLLLKKSDKEFLNLQQKFVATSLWTEEYTKVSKEILFRQKIRIDLHEMIM